MIQHMIVLLEQKLYRYRNICTGILRGAVVQKLCVGQFLGQLIMRAQEEHKTDFAVSLKSQQQLHNTF